MTCAPSAVRHVPASLDTLQAQFSRHIPHAQQRRRVRVARRVQTPALLLPATTPGVLGRCVCHGRDETETRAERRPSNDAVDDTDPTGDDAGAASAEWCSAASAMDVPGAETPSAAGNGSASKRHHETLFASASVISPHADGSVGALANRRESTEVASTTG